MQDVYFALTRTKASRYWHPAFSCIHVWSGGDVPRCSGGLPRGRQMFFQHQPLKRICEGGCEQHSSKKKKKCFAHHTNECISCDGKLSHLKCKDMKLDAKITHILHSKNCHGTPATPPKNPYSEQKIGQGRFYSLNGAERFTHIASSYFFPPHQSKIMSY